MSRDYFNGKRFITKEFWLSNAVYFVAAVFVVVMSLLSDRFLTQKNIINLFTQSAMLMILSMGMSLAMITKGIDMSIGAVMFLCAVVMQYFARSLGTNMLLTALSGIVVGLIIGAINGAIAAKLRVYPLLTTLGVMYVCRGIGLRVTGGRSVMMPLVWGKLTTFKVLGVPVQVYVAIAIAVVVQILVKKTSFGRRIFAVGDSEKTAHEKGINIVSVKILVYSVSGFMAALAGIISSSQVMSVPANMGANQEFFAIIASVLGGTSLFGGKGNIFPGCLIGAVIMSSISNSLVLLGAPPSSYSVVYACVIFLVVLMDTIKQKSGR